MTRTGLVVAMLALALGAALGYLVGAGQRPPPEASASPEPARTGARPAPPETAGPVTSLPALARASSRGPDAGTGRITGRVTLEDGRGVAGARIRAGGREATTDGSGRFVLTGVPEDEQRVEGFLPGHEIRPRTDDGDVAWPGDERLFLAVPVTDFAVSVLMPDGSPAERARLDCRRVAPSRTYVPVRRETWTPRRPVLRLDVGAWRISATGGPHGVLRSEETTVAVGGPGEPLTLRLLERPGIRGRLRFAEGCPGVCVQLHRLPVAPGAEVPVARILRDGEYEDFVAGLDTEYAFLELAPGTWVLLLTTGRTRVIERAVVEVAGGVTTRDFAIPPPEPGDQLVLRIEAPDGTPVRDVSVRTGYAAKHFSSSGPGEATVLPDGTLRVLHHDVLHEDRFEEGGRYSVTVSSPLYGEIRREYDPDETPALTLRFEEPARLEARIEGFADSPHRASLRIRLEPTELQDVLRTFTPDAEGRHAFPPCPPGEYVLRLGVNEGIVARWISSRRVRLRRGTQVETLVIPALHELTVEVGDLPEGRRIGLRREEGEVSEYLFLRFPTDGRVRFDRLPAGRYTVYCDDPDRSGDMTVELTGTTTIRFEP